MKVRKKHLETLQKPKGQQKSLEIPKRCTSESAKQRVFTAFFCAQLHCKGLGTCLTFPFMKQIKVEMCFQ